MATLKQQIINIIGFTPSEDAQILDYLKFATRYLTDILPEDIINQFMYVKPADEYNTVSDKTANRVIDLVNVYGLRSRRLPLNEYYRNRDIAGSIFTTVSSINPYYAVESNGSVLTENTLNNVYYVKYPSMSLTDESIADFPLRAHHATLLFASIGLLRAKSLKDYQALYTKITDLYAIAVPVAPEAPSFTWADPHYNSFIPTSIGSLPTIPQATVVTETVSFSNAESYISTEEDLDKASVELNQIQTKLQKVQNDYSIAFQNHNAKLKEYDALVTKEIEQARLTQQKVIEETSRLNDYNLQLAGKALEAYLGVYSMKLQRYQAQVQAYQAEIMAQANIIQSHIQSTQGIIALIEQLRSEFLEAIQMLTGQTKGEAK